MAVIPAISSSNSIDQWRQIDNQVITAINNQDINEIVQIVDPLNPDDILSYQATGPQAGFFINVGIAALVTATINALASQPVNNVLPYYLSQGCRQIF